MSIDYGTYVGPYVRCVVGQVDTQKERPQCTKCGRGYASPLGFCHDCGGKIDMVAHIEMDDAVDDWDVREHIQDRLATPSGDGYYTWKRENHAHLWVPNINSSGYHLDTREDFNLVEITDIGTVAFELQFSGDIAYLRSQYGADNVTIHWGIIQDYS